VRTSKIYVVAVWFLAAAVPTIALAAEAMWTATSNDSGCSVWNPRPVPDESVEYIGACRNGLPTGEGTVVWYVQGTEVVRYHGPFTKGHLQSACEFTYADGTHYVGRCKESEWLRGTVTSGGGSYKGDFVNWRFEGRGVMTRASGWRYEGDFVAGKMQGHGKETDSNGDRYEGGFMNDKRHGTGTVYFARGGQEDVVWVNGQLQ
jgi:hypothetical protein